MLEGGRDGVGEWSAHKRNLVADYTSSVNGELPVRGFQIGPGHLADSQPYSASALRQR